MTESVRVISSFVNSALIEICVGINFYLKQQTVDTENDKIFTISVYI